MFHSKKLTTLIWRQATAGDSRRQQATAGDTHISDDLLLPLVCDPPAVAMTMKFSVVHITLLVTIRTTYFNLEFRIIIIINYLVRAFKFLVATADECYLVQCVRALHCFDSKKCCARVRNLHMIMARGTWVGCFAIAAVRIILFDLPRQGESLKSTKTKANERDLSFEF